VCDFATMVPLETSKLLYTVERRVCAEILA